ncbi:MAG: ABC transporter ATP-binding protein [Myxococcales bacterium]
MELGYGKLLEGVSYEEAILRVTAALKEQGFGVITEIDVRKTMKEKLDVDFRPYAILGACQPKIAHAALSADLDIGLLLPCNVVVWEEEAGAMVKFASPRAIFQLIRRDDLGPLAEDVENRIRRAWERV